MMDARVSIVSNNLNRLAEMFANRFGVVTD